jgi:hypothetical protein
METGKLELGGFKLLALHLVLSPGVLEIESSFLVCFAFDIPLVNFPG